MNKFTELLITFASYFLVVVLGSLLMAFITQWIWNEVLVTIVDFVNPITFWQAFSINILCDILFKSHVSKKD
jgi:hypothetical protein